MADVKIPKEVLNGLFDYFLNGQKSNAALERYLIKELLKKQSAIEKRENRVEEYYRNKRLEEMYERVYPEEPEEVLSVNEKSVVNFQELDEEKNNRLKALGLDKYFKWENGVQVKLEDVPTHEELLAENHENLLREKWDDWNS